MPKTKPRALIAKPMRSRLEPLMPPRNRAWSSLGSFSSSSLARAGADPKTASRISNIAGNARRHKADNEVIRILKKTPPRGKTEVRPGRDRHSCKDSAGRVFPQLHGVAYLAN